MKPERGPQTMFFGNECCGIIAVQIHCGIRISKNNFRGSTDLLWHKNLYQLTSVLAHKCAG